MSLRRISVSGTISGNSENKHNDNMNKTEARCAMERCTRDVRAWMIIDKLKLNEEKTEFMLIGTREHLVKVRSDSLLVGD